ncbi:helicase C-terminal domain-containing protein [Lapidilactobacillus wuchangensis]|uniref:helicase C-terminal domain-containing protein n=1 Tax=Lapidilactobacillus wuchangensis TaxID=2486001 RepID=UPI0013DD9224|nr:helicase C-terminal domain-containing protein [Lapidilactobacillus wuchangensis]
MSGKTYAVVDLETTGTQRHANHHIIQFGCAIITDQKISEHISLTINPLRPVPKEIIELTKIDPAILKTSPTFAEVAPTLHDLLSDKIFVAHNVNFDLPFLNEEFKNCGLPPLTVAAIDTVELAQIMLPQAPSYRLQDLSTYLNIVHRHPHQADSDAIATAKILRLLLKRVKQMPGPLLKQLARLSQSLSLQTGQVFQEAYQQNQQLSLPNYLQQIGPFVLRREPRADATLEYRQLQAYPQTAAQKTQRWGHLLKPRAAQFKMMDFIEQQLTTKDRGAQSQKLVVEAPTGIGKSLGYLLPLSYQLTATPARRIVITTPTTVLQSQLKRQALPMLNDLRATNFSSVVLKSATHYLDLSRFANYLRVGQQNRGTVINEMRILVWLTQTRTGDLDELQLTNYETAFFQSINHLPTLSPGNRYYQVDFWRRVQEDAASAAIVLTNNAYLAQHLSDFTREQSILVIDEAQHFADDLTRSSRHYFSTMKLAQWSRQVSEICHYLLDNADIEPALTPYYYQLSTCQHQLDQFTEALQDLNDQIILLVGQNFITQPVYLDLAPKQTRQKLQQALTATISQLDHYLERCLPVESAFDRGQVSGPTQQRVNHWQLLNNQLESSLGYLIAARDHLQNPVFASFGFYLDVDDDGISYRFNWLAKTHEQLREELDQQFPAQLYTGASLAVGQKFDYFLRQLNLTSDQVTTLQLASPFDYANKAELLLPTTTYSPSENGADYDRWLAKTILPILQATTQQTMILFNSLASVKNVYYALQPLVGNQRELFAQGVTGSNDKIAKRFRFAHHGVLLGSQSFWEGVDFPGEQLSLLIITRIPFESPKNPMTNYRQSQMTAGGQSPFYADTLPRAILKLKQGFGRLIRTETDRGIVLLLDERVAHSSYASEIQQAFPQELSLLTLDNQVLPQHIHDFYQEK